MPVVTRVGRLSMAVVLVVAAMSAVRGESPAANPLVDELEKASAAYAEAFNKRDYAALADQWTARAELVEGGARLQGRDTIVASIRAWQGLLCLAVHRKSIRKEIFSTWDVVSSIMMAG